LNPGTEGEGIAGRAKEKKQKSIIERCNNYNFSAEHI